MPAYVSPGVYTREIDLSLYVPSLSTTIVGMVGVTGKGPTQTRTYITSQQQFIETFGEPDSSVGFESYAALQYLRRGRQLWFVRVAGAAAAEATETFYFITEEVDESISTEPDGVLTAFADTDPDGAVFQELGDGGIFPGSVTITVTIETDAEVEITDDGEGVLSGSDTLPATFAATGTINYATGAWTLATTGTSQIKTGTPILATYSYLTDAFIATATSVGEWGNNISIIISDALYVADSSRLDVYYDGVRVERFENIDLNDTSDNFIETKINGVSEYITVAVDAGVTGTEVLAEVLTADLLAGGDTDASSVVAADIVGVAWDGGLSQATGLQLFASPSAVDLNLLAAPGWSDAAVVQALIEIAETRADCMCIVDPPTDLSPTEVVQWHNGEGTFNDHAAYNSSYAATYYPWVQVYDSYNREYVYTPPSGHALAVFAYTDYNAETWYAPAGFNRGRVISGVNVAHSCSPGEMDLLYGDGNAVNPIANFNPEGLVIWGQRTLQRAPTALDRINVRRLLLYLRKVISTAAGYLVFEPNDSITWKSFGHLVTPYLNDVRQRRALYDFRVKCDETTNTPAVIDRNEMRAQILLKPVKAAEFIQIDFVITSTGVNFDEVIY